jgi:hypothetical protein
VADALALILSLTPGAARLLHLTILGLYHSFGILDGGKRYPTLFDLYIAILNNKTTHTQTRGAVIAALEPVLLSLGSVLCYRIGWKTEDLAEMMLVFELGGVSEVDKNLILITMLTSEFTRAIAAGIANQGLRLLIVCDEAARLVADRGSAIADMVGAVRGMGIGLDLSVQSSQIAPSVMSNTGSKFLGRCGSATDYDAMAAAMGLSRDQRLWLPTHLVPGQFVVSLSQGWRHPFLLKIPEMDISLASNRQAASTGDLHSSSDLGPLLSLDTVLANEFVDWKPAWLAGVTSGSSQSQPSSVSTLTPDEMDFLEHVACTPGRPSSHYPKLARIGTSKAMRIRQRLVGLGYLREEKMNSSGRGRSAIALFPTDLGTQTLDDSRSGG